MFEDAGLKHTRTWMGRKKINSQSLFFVKKGLMPNAAPPVEIRIRVVAISQTCRNWNNALIDVVGKRDEHVE